MPLAIRKGGFFDNPVWKSLFSFLFSLSVKYFVVAVITSDGRLMVKGDPNIGIDMLTECARDD